ncbi:MAG: hypothetical protein ACXQS8_00390 [Candidatus Helarchaeales archaeon]
MKQENKIFYPSKKLIQSYIVKLLLVFLFCEALLLILTIPLMFNLTLLDLGDFFLIVPLTILIIVVPLLYFRKLPYVKFVFFLTIESLMIIIYLGFTKVFSIFAPSPALLLFIVYPQLVFLIPIAFITIFNLIWMVSIILVKMISIRHLSYEISPTGLYEKNNFKKENKYIGFDKVRLVDMKQDIIEKIFGINRIEINGGSKPDFVIDGVENPDEIFKIILKKISPEPHQKATEKKSHVK